MGEATTTEDPKSGASCGPLLMNTFEMLAAGSCRHPVGSVTGVPLIRARLHASCEAMAAMIKWRKLESSASCAPGEQSHRSRML